MFRSTHSTRSSRAFEETVVPPPAASGCGCDRDSMAQESDIAPLEPATYGRQFAPERTRVTHFAIRIGKHFEFVVECCCL